MIVVEVELIQEEIREKIKVKKVKGQIISMKKEKGSRYERRHG
jgi:hypothetical protein